MEQSKEEQKDKFALLIVDDKEETRKNYRDLLTNDSRLKTVWYKFEDRNGKKYIEAPDAEKALNKIEWYVNKYDRPMIVISDVFMNPNCSDGNKPTEELFGGFWLVDKVNKAFKDRVKIILVSFYDRRVKKYTNRHINNFKYNAGFDYHFIKKPNPLSEGFNEETGEWEKDEDYYDDIIGKTFEIVFKEIEKLGGPVLSGSNTIGADPFDKIIGKSKAIRMVKEKGRKIAKQNISVLITGESGTGKEPLAKAIHSKSHRKEKELFIVHSGAIPDGVIESELFGHEKGSFTGASERRIGYFEKANGGTIFLDEIGDAPKDVQVKLLRVLETGGYYRVGSSKMRTTDVRVIAATNKNLKHEVENGSFRKDLFYRLKGVSITIPSLKKRSEDIPLLIDHFIQKNKDGNKIFSFEDKAIEYLKNDINWDGNIRELMSYIENVTVFSNEQIITKEKSKKYYEDFDNVGRNDSTTTNTAPQIGDEVSLEKIKKPHIISILKRYDWNAEKASKILGEGAGSSTLGTFKNHCMIFILERNDWDIEKASEVLGKGCRKKHFNKLKKEYHPEFGSIKEDDSNGVSLNEIKEMFTEEMFCY